VVRAGRDAAQCRQLAVAQAITLRSDAARDAGARRPWLTLRALSAARTLAGLGLAVIEARGLLLGAGRHDRARRVARGEAAHARRRAALAGPAALRSATDGLFRQSRLAMVRVTVRVGAARQGRRRRRQATAIAPDAHEVGLIDASGILIVQDAGSDFSRRVAMLANPVTGKIAAHPVGAMFIGAIFPLATRLPVLEQTQAADFPTLGRAHANTRRGANAPAFVETAVPLAAP
jgi:hypothetical protein